MEETEKEKPLVLVVDDDPIMRSKHVKLLEEFSVRTKQVNNTIDAERLMREERPTLVLLDDIMPDCPTGLSLLEKVKKDTALAYIPIIMVTASDKREERDRGFRAGAAAYITKPVDQALLREAISSVLSRRRKNVLVIMGPSPLTAAIEERLIQFMCETHVSEDESGLDAFLMKGKQPDLVIASLTAWQSGGWWRERLSSRPELGKTPVLLVGSPPDNSGELHGASALALSTGRPTEILAAAARLMRGGG